MATPKIRASVQLCSLDDVREWVKKSGAALEPPTDQFLGRIIDRVSMWVENYTNRDYLKTDHTKYYIGNGTPLLWSRVAPIADEADQGSGLPKIETWNGTVWEDVTATTLPYLDYIDADGAGRLVLRSGVWSKPYAPFYNYRITITAGFGTVPESMPDDLRQAAAIMCDIVLRYRELGTHILSSQSNVEGISWSPVNMASEDVNNLKFVFGVLGNYRLTN